jgi:hypothetical protein
MACPGVHCACCAGGIAVPVVPLLEVCGAVWVIEHLVEMVIVCGVSGALAVAASIALFRWADRRDARQAVRWRLLHVREVSGIRSAAADLEAEISTACGDLGASPERPALAPALTLNFYGADSGDVAARVIRTALPGYAEGAITEGK